MAHSRAKSPSKLNGLLEDAIRAIQSVVQKKDPATARHQARVWKLACAIGREMGLGKTRVAIIGLAALVHDFGKVFIPSDILNKPGKLTEAEFSAVKSHAEAVFQILSTIDLFCPIADIVHQHHERMNGSGYPLGLKGDDILLEARIIAVADVVEAMLSDRPHRPALGVEAAMKEIAGGRVTLYDADAADACIRLFRVRKFEFDAETDLVAQASPSES
jgi:HD-GYP domain-containing protein (c-di-GMP phosphodiesterase class II)